MTVPRRRRPRSLIAPACAALLALGAVGLPGSTFAAFTDTTANGPSTFASATTFEVAPTNAALPSISGDARVGAGLTGDPGRWSGTEPMEIAYAWSRCAPGGSCAPIAAATSPSYTVRAEDAGYALELAVTARNRAGRATASARTPAVVAPPAATAPPAISGTPREGHALSASRGTWSGQPTAYVERWLRCDAAGSACVAIPAATGTRRDLAADDVGHTLRVEVEATGASGTGVARSAPSAVITAAVNLLCNSSFERVEPDGRPSCWNHTWAGVARTTTASVVHGRLALRGTASDAGGWLIFDSDRVAVTPGRAYAAAFSARSERPRSGDTVFRAELIFFNAAGTAGVAAYSRDVPSSTSYQRTPGATVTAPAGAATAMLRIVVVRAYDNPHYVDAAQLEETSVATPYRP